MPHTAGGYIQSKPKSWHIQEILHLAHDVSTHDVSTHQLFTGHADHTHLFPVRSHHRLSGRMK